MSAATQRRLRDAYLGDLRERDGVPAVRTQRFDVRERLVREIDGAPARWIGLPPVDRRVFDRNHARARPEPGLDEAAL